MPSAGTRRSWLAASIAASVASILIAVSGGFAVSVGGVRVSARSWHLSAAAAGVAGLGWLWTASRSRAIGADVEALGAFLETRGRSLALGIATLAVITALAFSSYSASGADASGYLSQAAMWSHLRTRVADPIVALPNWPLAPGDTAPLGWTPALVRGWQVPTYAPGLPWLMALPHALAGTTGAVLVVVLSTGVAVWATGALAWRLGGGVAALIAATLVATSPTFLYHAFQPMSDVPGTAAWIVCWLQVARAAPASSGLAAAVATLIRPNLAPLAAVPWLAITLAGDRAGLPARAVRFALPVTAAGLVIALLQWHWYGSPLRSGYGSAGELFTLSNLGPNGRLYASWLWNAERAFVLLSGVASVCAAISAGGRTRRRPASEAGHSREQRVRLVVGLVCFSIGVAVAYFVYAVFDVWSYLRFLLPAMAVSAALIGAAIARALRIPGAAWAGAAALVLVVVASAMALQTTRRLGVFEVAAATARARDAGGQLARRLPAHAVLLAGEQSGSMRYATGRPVVRWETLDADSLRAALAVLAAEGLEAWWVLDQFEEARVRARFPGVPEAALDWPPEVEAGPLMRTRAWRIGAH